MANKRELNLEDLDQVVGGAMTAQAPIAAVDHSQDAAFLATLHTVATKVADAAADMNAHGANPAADIQGVENAAQAGGVATDAALAASLGVPHGKTAVVQELSSHLGSVTAE